MTDELDRRLGTPRVRPLGAAALAALTLAAAWLRWRVAGQPIRYDEAVTWMRYASVPLSEGLSLYDLPNNHLFHTLLVHLSTDLLGDGVRALRLPALLAGTALVPAVWWLGRAAAGKTAGWVAASAVAVSPVLVLFSTNARGYGLVVLAFAVLARLALDLRREGGVGRLAAFAIVAALAGWTMPAALYPAAAAGAWLVAPAGPGEEVRPLKHRLGSLGAAGTAAAGAAAVLYLPVLRRSGLDSLVANRFVAPRGPLQAARELPEYLVEVGRQWSRGVPDALVALLAAGAAAAVALELRRWPGRAGREGPPALLPVAVAASATVLVAHGRVPFARVWLYLLPAFALFAGRGIAAAGRALAARAPAGAAGRLRRATGAAAVVALLGTGSAGLLTGEDPVLSWGLTGALPHGDRVARYLADRVGPDDAVRASLPFDAPLEFYFRRLGVAPGTVNGAVEPGGCLYVVADGVRDRRPGRRSLRLLHRFGDVGVYARTAGPGGGAGACGEAGGEPSAATGSAGSSRPAAPERPGGTVSGQGSTSRPAATSR